MLEKKSDGVQYFILILIGILLIGGIYFFFSEPSIAVQDNYQYSNGESTFNVTKVSDTETHIPMNIGTLSTIIYTLVLRNDPLSLEDITVEGALNTRIFGDEEIYVTINPNAGLTSKTTIAALEIDKTIDNDYLYGVPVHSAMTQENTQGYPVKSCYDGSDNTTIIWLTLGSETKVYTDEYCIIIVGTDENEIIRAADRMLYQLLGIME
ncbi:MAG TPA: hypothetical protein HA370_02400 [Nanoarchaeota archaeon]|nr:hypothetical protein [Nanoarchaeota archaeon]